jgi:hypothetical protein
LVQCPSKFQIAANGDQRHAHVVRRPMRFIEYSAKSRQRGTMPYQRSRGSFLLSRRGLISTPAFAALVAQ